MIRRAFKIPVDALEEGKTPKGLVYTVIWFMIGDFKLQLIVWGQNLVKDTTKAERKSLYIQYNLRRSKMGVGHRNFDNCIVCGVKDGREHTYELLPLQSLWMKINGRWQRFKENIKLLPKNWTNGYPEFIVR